MRRAPVQAAGHAVEHAVDVAAGWWSQTSMRHCASSPAGLGIGVIPQEVTRGLTAQRGVKILPLTDGWAQRRFAVCFRSQATLTPAALRMVEHWAAEAHGAAGLVALVKPSADADEVSRHP